MRALHIVHAWPPEAHGGVQAYVRDLVDAQRAAGDAPALLTGSFTPTPVAQTVRADEPGLPVVRLHRGDDFAAWHARAWHPDVAALFARTLADLRPDVVHLHHWLYLSTDLVATAVAARVPVVVTLHDLYVSCPRCYRVDRDGRACERRLGIAACRPCVPRLAREPDADVDRSIAHFQVQLEDELRLAAAVLTSTAVTAELLARTTALPRTRFSVVPFGYRRRLAGPTAAPPAPPPWRFVYLGELSAAKGVSVLLRAFRAVVARAAVPVVLELFGGTADAAYRREVDELACDLPVTCRGTYRAADLAHVRAHAAVLPMISFQTWCFVLDECRELGLPCIVTDLGALPHRAGAGALIVPPDDVDALAAAMLRCIGEPGLLARLRAAPPPLPEPMDVHAAALAAVYRAALAGPRSTASGGGVPRGALLAQRERLRERLDAAASAGDSTVPA